MAKITGLDIPPEFLGLYNKYFTQDWYNQSMRICRKVSLPGIVKARATKNRSYIPDFVADWAALSSVQKATWETKALYEHKKPFALFFQNNFYRYINGLALTDHPDRFTQPTIHMHINNMDYENILTLEIANGDFVLLNKHNIKKALFSQQLSIDTITSTGGILETDGRNIIDEEYNEWNGRGDIYWTKNGEIFHGWDNIFNGWMQNKNSNWDEFELLDPPSEPDTIFRNFKISWNIGNAQGDYWFKNCNVYGIEPEGEDHEINNSYQLADLTEFIPQFTKAKRQWSFTSTDPGSYVEYVFPYAHGYSDTP